MSDHFKSSLAEFMGTFAIVMIGAGAVCMHALTEGKVGVVGVAFAYGLALTAMTYAFGAISGGHFNPAITIAFSLTHRIEKIRAIFYLGSQLLGAALAGLLLRAVFHNFSQIINSAPFLGACDISGVGFKAGTLLEAIGTFFLVSTFYATRIDPRGFAGTAPLAVGLTVVMEVLAMGPLTGGAFNPARAFGPAVATGYWANWYVYWAGPVAGAVLAAIIYEYLFLAPQPPKIEKGNA